MRSAISSDHNGGPERHRRSKFFVKAQLCLLGMWSRLI